MTDALTWPSIITTLLDGEDLSVSQADWAMSELMTGGAAQSQIAAFLVALRSKGVTVEEVIGFRDAILAAAEPISLPKDSLDIVGTGGDRFGTVNISSMASITAAGAGVPVVKHGNKAASSLSGSSDVLSALGIDLGLDAEQLAASYDEAGIAFVHAARFLTGFRHVAPVRAELGIPTVFNFLGPLCNPVRPEASAVGVADLERVPIFVGVFQLRGAAALVFRGDDGLDELTTTGHSRIWEVSRGAVTEHDLDPRDLGIPRAKIDELRGGTPDENADVVRSVLSGEAGPVRDIVLLNAAAGLIAYDLHADPESAERPLLERFERKLEVAADSIDSGRARQKLDRWAEATRNAAQA